MKRTNIIPCASGMLLAVLCLAVTTSLHAAGRYDSIIQYDPFGLITPQEAAARIAQQPKPVAPEPPPPAWAPKVRLSQVTELGSGEVLIGFVYTDGKSSKSYQLRVGQSKGDFGVKSVDVDERSAVISYQGMTETFRMGGMTSLERTASAAGVTAAISNTPKPAGPRGARTAAARTSTDSANRASSYHEMLRKRREEERKRREEAERKRREETERLTGEALRKHLREYNMELIRSGGQKGPPLPIELTPEEDAQLVAEGHLPSRTEVGVPVPGE